jgi:phage shock protein PspC (stress-responsive transcriptional regulator)
MPGTLKAMTTDTSPRTLTRSRTDRMVGGISAGMARYLGLDPAVVRVGWVVTTLFTGGAAIIAYLAMIAIIPNDEEAHPLGI